MKRFTLFLILAIGLFMLVSIHIVNADDFGSSSNVYTCKESLNGGICQEFPAATCDSNCTTECLRAPQAQTEECQIGSCFNHVIGSCTPQSAKYACEGADVVWLDNAAGNVAECQKKCCVIGTTAMFDTTTACNRIGTLRGTAVQFKPEITNEAACLLQSNSQDEGACIFTSGYEKSCRRSTVSLCGQLKGEFHLGELCSNTGLNTSCVKQTKVECSGDGVYWFDSCGNKENIYDANKENSWNDGLILSKNESCSLGTSNSPFLYQGTCGNCNYLSGSKCGAKTATEKLAANYNVVCRDLRCDTNGDGTFDRENGESWCVYQGAIGTETGSGGYTRSSAAVGSRHFRQVCIDGKVETEPCEDYRSQICVQNVTTKTAQCRINDFDTCYTYNASSADGITACNNNPDCTIKSMKMSDYFYFDACVPRYPPGFDLTTDDGSETATTKCGYATQTCTVTYMKMFDWFGFDWECAANCECENSKSSFAEQMNDYCVSMGDCGTKVNIVGKLTSNHRIWRYSDNDGSDDYTSTYAFSDAYTEGLKRESNYNYSSNAYALPGDYWSSYIGSTYTGGEDTHAGDLTENIVFNLLGGQASIISLAVNDAPPGFDNYEAQALNAFGSLIFSGIGGGAVVTGLLSAIGVGDTRTVTYTYSCYPWAAPDGGDDCGRCGEDGLKCDKYQCTSLGEYCEYINEGTSHPACVSVSPSDVNPPVITPFYENITEGYSYTAVGDDGFKIKSETTGDGCIPSYERLQFGIELDEAAQCKYAFNHSIPYDNMPSSFGELGIAMKEHLMNVSLPSLDLLGVVGQNPFANGEYNIYIRCKDSSGNKNTKDYAASFCVSREDDAFKPTISGRVPTNEYLKYGVDKVNITIFPTEPSECRYSSADKSYDEMENNMSCIYGLYAWNCKNEFNAIGNVTNYYVRCRDQPWLIESPDNVEPSIIKVSAANSDGTLAIQEVNASATKKRNTMTESYPVVVRKTTTPLRIDTIYPSNVSLYYGTEPATVNTSLTTAGGLDGKAVCYYKSGNSFYRFSITNATTHKHNFNSMMKGDKLFVVKCIDAIGNVAERNSSFTILIDSQPPIMTKIYHKAGTIYLITDESSECRYKKGNKADCSFSYLNGTTMTGNQLIHSSNFEENLIYSIKCRDNYGNFNGDCITVAAPGVGFYDL